MASELKIDDYHGLFRSLLPRGIALQGEEYSQFVRGMAVELARVASRASELRQAFYPDTATSLLPEWADAMGVAYDPRNPEATRSRVLSRFAASGGHARATYLAFLMTIAPLSEPFIRDFERTRAGARAGARSWSEPWEHCWEISNIRADDLETVKGEIENIAQAHVLVLYRIKEDHVPHP